MCYTKLFVMLSYVIRLACSLLSMNKRVIFFNSVHNSENYIKYICLYPPVCNHAQSTFLYELRGCCDPTTDDLKRGGLTVTSCCIPDYKLYKLHVYSGKLSCFVVLCTFKSPVLKGQHCAPKNAHSKSQLKDKDQFNLYIYQPQNQ